MKNPLKKSNRDYVILTDTASDLNTDMLNSLGVFALPMHVLIDSDDYIHYADYRNLSKNDFFEKLKSCKEIKTAQIDTDKAVSIMRNFLTNGKDILYIAFSSGLSGSYSTGTVIAEELQSEFPKSKIKVIDSLCASGGEGLLVYLAAQKKANGMDFDALTAWVEDTKLRIAHWFTVDDLMHLKKGGRISAATAALGGLLSIKPVLHMDNSGHLTPNCKSSGRKKALEALADKMKKHTDGNEFDTVFISHAACEDDAEVLKCKLNERFNIKEIFIVDIDPVIAAHTGAECIALFFVGNER